MYLHISIQIGQGALVIDPAWTNMVLSGLQAQVLNLPGQYNAGKIVLEMCIQKNMFCHGGF